MPRVDQRPKMLTDTRHCKKLLPVKSRSRGILVHLLIISCTICLLLADSFSEAQKFPLTGSNSLANVLQRQEPKKYAIIFDAGEHWTRVHVFCFDPYMNLLPIGNYIGNFMQISPGLKAYENRPEMISGYFLSLIDRAKSAIPKDHHNSTVVRIGATSWAQGNAYYKILQAIISFLKNEGSFHYEADDVTIVDRTQESVYKWITTNYLLGNLGKNCSSSVGVIDLGQEAVQMVYAISNTNTLNAQRISVGDNANVLEKYLNGRRYHLYTKSFEKHGVFSVRAEILKLFNNTSNPCVLEGFHGTYRYGGEKYYVTASPSGSSIMRCRELVRQALGLNKIQNCRCGEKESDGVEPDQDYLYISPEFFYKSVQLGLIDCNADAPVIRATDYGNEADRACRTKMRDAKSRYRLEDLNLPYICMDLVYLYTMLVDGLGLDPWQEIKLLRQVKYQDWLAGPTWPLGYAIDVASSITESQMTAWSNGV